MKISSLNFNSRGGANGSLPKQRSGGRGLLTLSREHIRTINANPFKRIRDQFKNNKKVDMCRQATLIRTPDEPTKKISTHGLVGCAVLALIIEHESGKQSVTMSHYPPDHHRKQAGKLEQTCAHLASDDPVQTKALVVLVPGERGKDANEGKIWKIERHNVRQIKLLESTAQLEPIVSPYEPEIRYRAEKHFPDLLVTLNREGVTWRSCGDGHILHTV